MECSKLGGLLRGFVNIPEVLLLAIKCGRFTGKLTFDIRHLLLTLLIVSAASLLFHKAAALKI